MLVLRCCSRRPPVQCKHWRPSTHDGVIIGAGCSRALPRHCAPAAAQPGAAALADRLASPPRLPACCVQVIGGIGAMDSIVTVDPDPQTDLKHVREGAGHGRLPVLVWLVMDSRNG